MNAMAKRPILDGPPADYGTSIRRHRGDVVVVDASDPDQPKGVLIRRAQIHDPVRASVARGGMAYRCYLAAEKFRDDYRAAEADARIPSQLRPRITYDTAAGAGDRKPINWIGAKDRLTRAMLVIGLQAQGVFWWCVVPKRAEEGRTFGLLDDYDTTRRWRKGTARDQLEGALARLADHYGLGNPEAPKDFR